MHIKVGSVISIIVDVVKNHGKHFRDVNRKDVNWGVVLGEGQPPPNKFLLLVGGIGGTASSYPFGCDCWVPAPDDDFVLHFLLVKFV